MKVLLGIVFITIVASGLVQTSQSEQVCDAELQVKLSMLAGLRQNHRMKVLEGFELMTQLNETEETLHKLERILNTTQVQAEELDILIENMTMKDLEDSYACENGVPTDCCQIKRLKPSARSGLYAIKDPSVLDRPFSYAKLTVNCDMETDGGGWIVIQRRNANLRRVNFFRSWADYEDGFGNLDGEFWIGLKNIYMLTHNQAMTLQISVWNDTDASDTMITWTYPQFRTAGPNEFYALKDSSLSGHGDGRFGAFTGNRRTHYLSTFDRDNDQNDDNCAYRDQTGWWLYYCGYANPNGRHQPTNLRGKSPLTQRLVWRNNVGNGHDIYTHSEMKLRPKSCNIN